MTKLTMCISKTTNYVDIETRLGLAQSARESFSELQLISPEILESEKDRKRYVPLSPQEGNDHGSYCGAKCISSVSHVLSNLCI